MLLYFKNQPNVIYLENQLYYSDYLIPQNYQLMNKNQHIHYYQKYLLKLDKLSTYIIKIEKPIITFRITIFWEILYKEIK
jgi:hypothetical protein